MAFYPKEDCYFKFSLGKNYLFYLQKYFTFPNTGFKNLKIVILMYLKSEI